MKHGSFTLRIVTCFAAMATVAYAQEENWNQFRGPNGDGKSLAMNLPVEFSESKNVRWKTPIHDRGWSSPVAWGDASGTARDHAPYPLPSAWGPGAVRSLGP